MSCDENGSHDTETIKETVSLLRQFKEVLGDDLFRGAAEEAFIKLSEKVNQYEQEQHSLETAAKKNKSSEQGPLALENAPQKRKRLALSLRC